MVLCATISHDSPLGSRQPSLTELNLWFWFVQTSFDYWADTTFFCWTALSKGAFSRKNFPGFAFYSNHLQAPHWSVRDRFDSFIVFGIPPSRALFHTANHFHRHWQINFSTRLYLPEKCILLEIYKGTWSDLIWWYYSPNYRTKQALTSNSIQTLINCSARSTSLPSGSYRGYL